MLTFIKGHVPYELANFDEPTLCEAASLIRRFHDLSSDLMASSAAAEAAIQAFRVRMAATDPEWKMDREPGGYHYESSKSSQGA